MPLKKYDTVPGRGLITHSAINYRKAYMESLGFDFAEIEKTSINNADIQNNIESLIGAVEIPVGLVGPLTYCTETGDENVFCAAATLEGALVASMNRGAKAISMSGGFQAVVVHQKMVRSPLFILNDATQANHFENWVAQHFHALKLVVEGYSNHAVLQEISSHCDQNHVHLNFVYTTGDAAGQNMTTTCTWHGILYIVEKYAEAGHGKIEDFVLEGNGSSDKKVSQFLVDHGRGTKVVATCILQEEAIQKVLRTSATQLLKFYEPSRKYAKKNGMVGYTINAANAVAAIFAATGQDLASVHESSVADLELKKHPEGLAVKLTLFSLVVGTVGGGTNLPKQQQALQLMGCAGSNKVQRFASLLAGFVMGLDLSTYAAMVSGEFAKAHEKLGRNKPVNWLQWNELDTTLIQKTVAPYLSGAERGIVIKKGEVDDGILMNLSKKVNRKLIGFIPVTIATENKNVSLLIKSKATDLEVIKGLHLMAASIDPALSDLFTAHKSHLEYKNCHIKELSIPQFLYAHKLNFVPKYYGQTIDEDREIYLLFLERLHPEEMALMDAENQPELWLEKHIKKAISCINQVHITYAQAQEKDTPAGCSPFYIEESTALYQKLIDIAAEEHSVDALVLHKMLLDVSAEANKPKLAKTLVHNDFNPRNIAIRKSGEICIYDWELAVLHYPHRDIIELLSFTLPVQFHKNLLLQYLRFHYKLANPNQEYTWENWKTGYIFTLKEYILSRILFYCAAEVLMKLKFVDRILANVLRMLQILEEDKMAR